MTVYVNFDEDDDNDLNIDLGALFKREDLSKPYHVEVSISFELKCRYTIIFVFNNLVENHGPLQLQGIDS